MFLNHSTLMFGPGSFLTGGLSCALQNIWQYPWPPPTGCQSHPSPICDNQKVSQTLSPDTIKCPGEKMTPGGEPELRQKAGEGGMVRLDGSVS